jgi:hypothetical protein
VPMEASRTATVTNVTGTILSELGAFLASGVEMVEARERNQG